MKFEVKDIVGKKFELKSELESVNTTDATAVFVLSTVDIDRHGDVIDQDSWDLKHFMNNPVFLEQHMSWEFPIGKFIEIKTEIDPNRMDGAKRLVGTVKFAVEEYDRAKVAFALIANGFMSAVSVGFIPHDVSYDDSIKAFIMKDCELLEVSLVSVPANPMALAKMREKALEKGIDISPLLEKRITPAVPTIKEQLIEVKDRIEEKGTTDTREQRAFTLINKAIRSLKF